jgi:hypothetical protein
MVLQTGEMPGATGLIRQPLQGMWGMTAVWALFLTCLGGQLCDAQAHKAARGKHRPEYWGCTVIGIEITDLSRSSTVQ